MSRGRSAVLAVSLALVGCLAVAWPLSYVHYRVDSVDGRLQVGVIHGGEPYDEERDQTGDWVAEAWKENAVRSWAVPGLEWHDCRLESGSHAGTREYAVTLVMVRYWLLILLAAVPMVAVAVFMARRGWRARRAAAAALAPALLLALFWALSHARYDFDSAAGRALLLVTYGGESPGAGRLPLESDWDIWTDEPHFSWSHLGCEMHRGKRYVSSHGADGVEEWDYGFTVVAIPYWGAMVVAALPAVAWGANAVRRRRRGRGQRCLHCGYDLRATPARCPECGAGPGLRENGPPTPTGNDG
ncbi:MAG TPA: hypothetical protein VFB66_30770 [Tepidisphaeraceae bacterium]|nr:hypothetical protein [Tepidisphaeraceae bacterium]